MTDFKTIVVPKDSQFVPSEQDAARSQSLLEEAFEDYPVTYSRYSAPRFLTSGDGFDKFTCPRCKTLVKRFHLDDSGKQWWYTVLWDLRSQDQVVDVPCCGAKVAVSEFDFGNDAAFASFELAVEGIGGLGELQELGEEKLQEIESILGCPTRWIVQVIT